jgi:hypothetical protein
MFIMTKTNMCDLRHSLNGLDYSIQSLMIHQMIRKVPKMKLTKYFMNYSAHNEI